MLVQMAISRSREYQADRMGSQICGNPRWLMSALLKIDEAVKRIRNKTADAHRSSAHMFIINPLTDRPGDSLFASHPSIQNRLIELEKLAIEMAGRQRGPSGPNPNLNGVMFPERGPIS
jgi:heat shock protein HtpX